MSTPLRALGEIAAALLICASATAADWPEWRGPHRDGALNAEPKAWPEKLKLQWKVDVGLGHASPVLAAGSIYIFARQDESETVLAIDPATGATRWKQQYVAPYTMSPPAVPHGPGPKSTPLYSNGRLYTFGISGILSAWDATNGKLVWRKEFAQYKTTSPTFGVAASPIIDGGLLIVHVGGTTSGGLTAFDPATGAVKWSWEGDSPAYSSPIVVDLAGVRQVVTQSRANIVSVAESTGKLLWKIPFTTAYEQNSVTPARYKDTLILSGLDKGVFAVRLTRTGDTLTPQTVWESKEVAMYMNSPVLSGDLLFGFSHRNKGQLFCLDAATGKTLWLGPPRTGENSALLRGGSGLLSLTNDGQLQVVKVNGKALEEIRRYTVADSATWAHPLVLADGVLIKDLKSLARWSVN
jgi:outer membrane protein assembly factor BamB